MLGVPGDTVQVMNAPPKGITDMERENIQAHGSLRREMDLRKKKERNVLLELFFIGSPLGPCRSSYLCLILARDFLGIPFPAPLPRRVPPPPSTPGRRSRFKSVKARRAEPREWQCCQPNEHPPLGPSFCPGGSPTEFLMVVM